MSGIWSANDWVIHCPSGSWPSAVWDVAASWAPSEDRNTQTEALCWGWRGTPTSMTLDHFRRTNRCGKCPYVSHISLCSCLLLLINRQLWPFFSEGCLRARNLSFSLLPVSLMEAWLILTAAVIHDAASFDCVCGSAQACHTPAVETWLNLS